MPFLIVLTNPTVEMLIKRFLDEKEAKWLAAREKDSWALFDLIKERKDYLFAEGLGSRFIAIKRERLGFCERVSNAECDEMIAKRKEAQQEQKRGPNIQRPAMIIPHKPQS